MYALRQIVSIVALPFTVAVVAAEPRSRPSAVSHGCHGEIQTR
jgi:hypothetical protein